MRLLPALVLFGALALSGTAASEQAQLFRQLLDEHWQWYLEENPQRRTQLGDHSAGDRWNDVSPVARERQDGRRAAFLQRLAAIDPAQLGGQEQLSYAMFRRRLEEARENYRLGLHLIDLNMRTGPQHYHSLTEYIPFATEADFQLWLERLAAVPKMLEGHTLALREGIARQRVQAREVLQRVPVQLDRLITADPAQSPFYKPFVDMPAAVSAAEAQALRERAQQLISAVVNPAYARFRDFISETYLPASRAEPGIGSLPGGGELYAFLARKYTTTDMSPQAIHDTGLREVKRILGEMESVKVEVGFEGDLQAFNQFLRSDPRFYYATAEELLQGYLAVSKRIDPELVNLFGTLPRMPYGVRPIPAEIAPDTTTAYYQPPAGNGTRAGYYYVNLYRPEVRPKYEMEVLSVHEAVPGHHLQIALAQEIEGLPEFRRLGGVTAFVEGWALYSERLGYQLGLYTDPYSRYGQLTYDMWRAVRLVVDTGIHQLGWSRQRAIDYFKANAGKSEADIINEIDRYIGWPGQALGYKIGQLKILELRARAERELGDAFDLRAFHDTMLGAGAIPLDALEQRMQAWIAGQG